MANQKIITVILAAGKSERFGSNKLKSILGAETVLEQSLKPFREIGQVSRLIVLKKGGKTRQQSTYLALEKIAEAQKPKNDDLVIFHNAANPLVSKEEILSCIKAAKKHGAAIVAQAINDTIKEVSGSKISRTLDRSKLRAAQTPQIFKWELIKKAADFCKKNKITVTDEASMLEAAGEEVYIVKASAHNKKITFKEDLNYVRFLWGDYSNSFKIGLGQDSHSFAEGRKGLCLGGLKFKQYKAFKANSDGDVILHALSNALLSAMGGQSFSRIADPLCKKGLKDSTVYLGQILKKMNKKNLKPHNLSLSLEGAYPKLEAKFPQIKKNLSSLLKLQGEFIGLSIHSGEKLTPFGEGKGLQCTAVVLLRHEN